MNNTLTAALAASVVALNPFSARSEDGSVAFDTFMVSPEVSLLIPAVPADSTRKPWHAAIMAWFAKHLQDDPKWWDYLYGD